MAEEASHTKVAVESAILAALMRDIFQGLQVSVQEGALVAEILLEASLAGYDSHGIMRIPMYAAGISSGTIVPGAGVEVLRETTASALLDARAGLGPVAAVAAVDLAIEKATESGVGCVSVVNCNDVARLGGYMVKPAEAGLMAIMSVNDAGHGPDVAPWGGVDPFLSTNPIAAGIPWRQQRAPVIIDVSTRRENPRSTPIRSSTRRGGVRSYPLEDRQPVTRGLLSACSSTCWPGRLAGRDAVPARSGTWTATACSSSSSTRRSSRPAAGDTFIFPYLFRGNTRLHHSLLPPTRHRRSRSSF